MPSWQPHCQTQQGMGAWVGSPVLGINLPRHWFVKNLHLNHCYEIAPRPLSVFGKFYPGGRRNCWRKKRFKMKENCSRLIELILTRLTHSYTWVAISLQYRLWYKKGQKLSNRNHSWSTTTFRKLRLSTELFSNKCSIRRSLEWFSCDLRVIKEAKKKKKTTHQNYKPLLDNKFNSVTMEMTAVPEDRVTMSCGIGHLARTASFRNSLRRSKREPFWIIRECLHIW